MLNLEVFSRVVIAFTVFFILARIMGRKEISQMTFYNFVSAIAIGSITANVAVNPSVSIKSGVLVLIGWTIFTIGMDFLDIKSKKLERLQLGSQLLLLKIRFLLFQKSRRFKGELSN